MKVTLPNNIDYSKYNSKDGLATKKWGPVCGNFLFTIIMGRYPYKLKNTKEHKIIRKQFKSLLTSLKDILPCVFCRNSFKVFLKELPINNFLVGRIELMYWLYLMKDKVNKKLIKQEKLCYNEEKYRLKQLYYSRNISKTEYYKMIRDFKSKTFQTVPTPPFKEVLDKYESIRAVCSKKSLSCVIPDK